MKTEIMISPEFRAAIEENNKKKYWKEFDKPTRAAYRLWLKKGVIPSVTSLIEIAKEIGYSGLVYAETSVNVLVEYKDNGVE